MKLHKKSTGLAHRWLASLVIAVATALIGVRTQPAAAAVSATIFKPGEIVVGLNPLSGATIAEINAAYGATTLESLPSLAGTFRLKVPAGQDPKAFALSLAADTRLAYAEVNFISQPPEADPSRIGAWGGLDAGPYTAQYASGKLGLTQAQALAQGSGVIVAILDTGVQLSHPALAGSLTAIRNDYIDGDAIPEDVFDQIDNDGDGLIDEAAGHGTHVAGIVHLVAPQAKLMPVRVLDSDGHGDAFSIAKAIDFAVQNGAKIINLSLGTADKVNVLDDAVKQATRAGVFVVSAAGNLGVSNPQWPAGSNCAIAVTSVGSGDVKSDFGNYGSWVDVAAPGEGIYSAFPQNGYLTWAGTSMATPFVAGQAALLLSKSATLKPADLANLIAGTTQNVDNLNPGYSGKLGTGRINVLGSLQQLATGTLPVVGGIMSSSCSEPLSPTLATATPTPAVAATATPLAPTQTSAPTGSEQRFTGILTSRPAGSIGAWVLGSRSFVADGGTEFQFTSGPLNVGVCAKVRYVNNGSADVALQIESELASDCGPSTGTATPSATSSATPAGTPSATSTPTPEPGFTNRAYGLVSAFPANLIGRWVVAGAAYTATASTEFKQLSGPFAVGACVKVKYTSQNIAVEIETESASDCGASGGGGQTPSLPGLSKEYATIGSLPASPYVGAWVIGGQSYQATSGTKFEQTRGAFAVGTCVEAKYSVVGGVKTLIQVESAEAYKCQSIVGSSPDPVFESYGTVEQYPANLQGSWRVSGITYTTDLSTTFQQERGLFAVGAFVEVKYRLVGGARVAVKIETHVAPGEGQGNGGGRLDTRPSDDWGNWVINGQTYQGDRAIEVEIHSSASQLRGPSASQLVYVNYYTVAGTRYATSVRELAQLVFLPVAQR